MPAQTGSVLGIPSPNSMRMAAVPGTLFCVVKLDGGRLECKSSQAYHPHPDHLPPYTYTQIIKREKRDARVQVPAEEEEGPDALLRLHNVLSPLHLLQERVRLFLCVSCVCVYVCWLVCVRGKEKGEGKSPHAHMNAHTHTYIYRSDP